MIFGTLSQYALANTLGLGGQLGQQLPQMQGGNLGQHWTPSPQTYGDPALASYPSITTASQIYAQQALQLAQQQAAYLAQYLAQSEAPRITLEDAGISAGEIVGHRIWRADKWGFLKSMAMSTIWPPDEPLHCSEELNAWNGCGVHAFKRQTDVLTEYGLSGGDYDIRAVGQVLLWGTVIEHENGYRAEWGRVLTINHLLGLRRWQEKLLLKSIRRRYGLDKPIMLTTEECDHA